MLFWMLGLLIILCFIGIWDNCIVVG